MESSPSTIGFGDPVQVIKFVWQVLFPMIICRMVPAFGHSTGRLMQVCGLEISLGYIVTPVCETQLCDNQQKL